MNWIKSASRPMNFEEQAMAKRYFDTMIPYAIISIDETAAIATKRLKIAYVSFLTINLHGSLRTDTLIHELVHIWQYVCYGPLYITYALFAQQTHEGYQYGREIPLSELRKKYDKKLFDFNFEQQAAIIEDTYLLDHNRRARYTAGGFQNPEIYDLYVRDMKDRYREIYGFHTFA